MNIFRSSYIQLLMFFVLIPSIRTATFKYIPGSETNIKPQGDATFQDDGIQLSTNRVDTFLNHSTGRALYAKPVRLWDSTTGELADFSTRFSFLIKVDKGKENLRGDGLAFFFAPDGSTIPPVSGGALLGLFDESVKFNSSKNPVVAVEFDTYYNKDFDPDGFDHVGIDINSIKSANTTPYGLFLNNITNAWICYDSSSKNLSVYVSPASLEISPSWEEIFISYVVDLRDILPEWVSVGLSATTGDSLETHQILSWEFNSTEIPSSSISIEFSPPSPQSQLRSLAYELQSSNSFEYTPAPIASSPSNSFEYTPAPIASTPTPAPIASLPTPYPSLLSPPPSPFQYDGGVEVGHKKNITTKLVIGLVVGITLLVVGVGMILFMWKKKGKRKNEEKEIVVEKSAEVSIDEEYEHKTGPTKYAYGVLVCATDNFNEDRKLGEGGFGSVYRGTLSDTNLDVAVKKISKGSKQGKKEFASEVAIIGKLVHRNLVQLLGWCQEGDEFLLVYDFMSEGSLDFHLFRGRSMLTWVIRYKIANGLASALQYLHEGWHQCVVHRDIKASNILLDSDFNAKLGDFGLARFVDHEVELKTTMLGGTEGYLAPECFHTGKSSKESDIYSFGVVVLEIACGRRVLMPKEKENKVRLLSWLWELYVSGRLLEAADTKLGKNFDEQQMERLMVVGLWCTTYDYNIRPSIKQVSSILYMEAPLPDLTMKMPLSTHVMPSMQNHGFSPASSSSVATNYQGRTSGSTHNTSSSHSIEMAKHSSYASLLHSEPR